MQIVVLMCLLNIMYYTYLQRVLHPAEQDSYTVTTHFLWVHGKVCSNEYKENYYTVYNTSCTCIKNMIDHVYWKLLHYAAMPGLCSVGLP